MKTTHHSYGIIPIYKKEGEIFVCCVHNIKSDEWGLPKGTPEQDEKPFETARRELQEETGIIEFEIIGGKTFSEKYTFEQDDVVHDKENTYYLAEVTEMKEVSPNIDSKNMRWINIKDADNFFKFDAVKNTLKEVDEYLQAFPLITEYHGISGEDVIFEYYNSDSIEHLPTDQLSQVMIVAFHGDKILIVNNTNKYDTYSLVGGGIEKGETPEECLLRELQEESNMKIVGEPRLIGYQKCTNLSNQDAPDEYQLRYFACVEPIGPFTPDCDPDGDVTELLEIDLTDYKKYFDWGRASDVITERALFFKKNN